MKILFKNKRKKDISMSKNLVNSLLKITLGLACLIIFGIDIINNFIFKNLIWSINSLICIIFAVYHLYRILKEKENPYKNKYTNKTQRKLSKRMSQILKGVPYLSVTTVILRFFGFDLFQWIKSLLFGTTIFALKLVGWVIVVYIGFIIIAGIIMFAILGISNLFKGNVNIEKNSDKLNMKKTSYNSDIKTFFIQGSICPRCNKGKLLERYNKKQMKSFLGCSEFSKSGISCRFTCNIGDSKSLLERNSRYKRRKYV